MAQVPLTVPPGGEGKDARGAGRWPTRWYIAFPKWLYQFFVVEPQVHFIDGVFGTTIFRRRPARHLLADPFAGDGHRHPAPAPDALGRGYGLCGGDPDRAAHRHLFRLSPVFSWFDNAGTFVTMVGFSVPPFFSGVLVIVIFSVWLGWFPSIYDTTHQGRRLGQLQETASADDHAGHGAGATDHLATVSRFMRASMLDNLNQDYVRTARAKGLGEKTVVLVHVLRNSLIPVVTVIALGVPVDLRRRHHHRTGLQGERHRPAC